MRKRLVRCVASLFVAFGCMTLVVADDEKSAQPPAPEGAAAESSDDADHSDADKKHADDHDSHAKGEHGEDGGHGHGAGDHGAGDHGAGDHGDGDHGDGDHGHGDHGGHGHHDPHDLSHVNAGPMLEDPSEWKADLAIWTFVIFLCLLAVLGKFAWGPIMDGLDKREASIAAMIDDAKAGQEEAAKQLQNYEAKLAAAGEEARELVAQARKDAEAAGERIKAEAQEAAQRERERAVADIEAAKNGALHELNEKSVDLAVGLAGQIVRRELKSDDHTQLIREALDKLPSRN